MAMGRAKEALEVWYGISTSSIDGQRFSRKQAIVALEAAGAIGDLNQVGRGRGQKAETRAGRSESSVCRHHGLRLPMCAAWRASGGADPGASEEAVPAGVEGLPGSA